MTLRAVVLSILASPVFAARHRVANQGVADDLKRDGQEALNVDSVACPVLASMVSAGFVKEDGQGRVSQNAMILGLMQTGNTQMMAVFQAKGIVAFGPDDIHQNRRVQFAEDSDRWVNFRIMNRQDFCYKGGQPNLLAGTPCNANPEHQQHGYSTLLRDPEGGATALERFNIWFGKPGVMTDIGGLGRVMTLQGLGNLVRLARETGDYSGEFSTNLDGSVRASPLEFYHPGITNPTNVSTIVQWQAVLAWSTFFAAFGHDEADGYPAHMKQSDLMSMFIDGKFWDGWSPKHYGFRETFITAAKLKGSGAGDTMSVAVEVLLGKLGREATEKEYFFAITQLIRGVGGGDDDISHSFPDNLRDLE